MPTRYRIVTSKIFEGRSDDPGVDLQVRKWRRVQVELFRKQWHKGLQIQILDRKVQALAFQFPVTVCLVLKPRFRPLDE